MLKNLLTLIILLSSLSIAQNKISVITTLFPIYDFSKTIGGTDAEVNFLLPPTIEPHSFEPTPKDMVKINKADLFIYTSHEMEPWAEDLKKGLNKNVTIIECSKGLNVHNEECEHHEEKVEEHEADHEHSNDPHIWLNPANCLIIIDNITNSFIKSAPEKKEGFIQRSQKLKDEIKKLDADIFETLSKCNSKTILYAGHFAFGYFAEHYNLNYITTYHGFSPDAEPSPKKMGQLINTVKQNKAKFIFYEALTEPKIAKTISKETGAEMLLLHSAANLSRDEFNNGETYISIMHKNLENLKKGLHCQ